MADADELPVSLTEVEDWREDCSCNLQDEDDLCEKHWPGLCLRNDARAESVDGEKRIGPDGMTRRKVEKEGGNDADWVPPFASNPFDSYHSSNKNKLRSVTVRSWHWWIGTHIKPIRTVRSRQHEARDPADRRHL